MDVPAELDDRDVTLGARHAVPALDVMQVGGTHEVAGAWREPGHVVLHVRRDEALDGEAVDRAVGDPLDGVGRRIDVRADVLSESELLEEIAVALVRSRVGIDLDRRMSREDGEPLVDHRRDVVEGRITKRLR